ncbi:hypothetical protein DENSPDRAFT_746094, partial [Dentipellis sp. KUC8613]
MLEIIRGVFNRNSEYLQGDSSMIEKARRLMVQIVNALTVKQEIGGPLASLYLLGNPDHYTNFQFKPFFWKSYVNEAKSAWTKDDDQTPEYQPKVIIGKVKGNMVAISPVLDYTLRPDEYLNMSLYDWIRLAEKQRIRNNKTKKTKLDSELINLELEYDVSDDESDDNDNNNDDKKGINKHIPQFQPEHPHHGTHTVKICKEAKSKIPSFIGVLPRADKGGHEEYCLTM